MPSTSAGLLPYRVTDAGLRVFLAHMGGPFWAKKDDGSWTLPKGEYDANEDPLAAARREFREETGFEAEGEFLPLGEVTQKAGKTVVAWAFASDVDPRVLRSNTFEMEWPPRSGKMRAFPEIDRAEWFSLEEAHRKILASQVPFLERLKAVVGG